MRPRFWETTPLARMTQAEWEALCDGCGKCCLIKLEEWDTGELAYTSIACRLYDPDSCRCMDYANRKLLVEGCVVLSLDALDEGARWMPETCAYRRLHENRPLPDWHPLLTGDPDSPRKAGEAATDWTTPEYEVPEEEWEDYVIHDLSAHRA